MHSLGDSVVLGVVENAMRCVFELSVAFTFLRDITMKNLGIVCAAFVIAAAASASAADRAVSKATLNSMGLGNMQQLSDSDGLAIRGKGTSSLVWGSGTANFLGQTSTNGYLTSSSHNIGGSSAIGGNNSYGGLSWGQNNGPFGSSGFLHGVAGGGSFGNAR